MKTDAGIKKGICNKEEGIRKQPYYNKKETSPGIGRFYLLTHPRT